MFLLCLSGHQKQEPISIEKKTCAGRRPHPGSGKLNTGLVATCLGVYLSLDPRQRGNTGALCLFPCEGIIPSWWYQKVSRVDAGLAGYERTSAAPPPTSCFIRHFPRSVSSAMAEGATSVAIISSSVSREQNVKVHPFRTGCPF